MEDKKWHKVKCSKCGKSKMTNPLAYAKRLAKFEGSVERMEKEWICRECSPKKTKKVKEEKVVAEPGSREKLAANLKKAKESIKANIPVSEPLEKVEEVEVVSEETGEEIKEEVF
jgi:hypothetical protein